MSATEPSTRGSVQAQAWISPPGASGRRTSAVASRSAVAKRSGVFPQAARGARRSSASSSPTQLAEREPAPRAPGLDRLITPTPDLSVDALARRAAMSSRRNFCRVFVREVGVDAWPVSSSASASRPAPAPPRRQAPAALRRIAAACGFGRAETLRLGVPARPRRQPEGLPQPRSTRRHRRETCHDHAFRQQHVATLGPARSRGRADRSARPVEQLERTLPGQTHDTASPAGAGLL